MIILEVDLWKELSACPFLEILYNLVVFTTYGEHEWCLAIFVHNIQLYLVLVIRFECVDTAIPDTRCIAENKSIVREAHSVDSFDFIFYLK